MAWRVSGPRLDPNAVIEGVVAGHQLRPTALHDWQQAVLVIRIGRVSGAQFGALPVFPFLPCKKIVSIGKRRHPSTIDEPRVPADMIGVEMRAQHIVDVLRRKAGGGKVSKIGPILSMVARGVLITVLWNARTISPLSGFSEVGSSQLRCLSMISAVTYG